MVKFAIIHRPELILREILGFCRIPTPHNGWSPVGGLFVVNNKTMVSPQTRKDLPWSCAKTEQKNVRKKPANQR
ncbi:hypothetical protein J0A67_04410 [Algoriphagus aestuariicola]|uniref:Uncharacterized protein n=1 Tax=Algoriphagus aestuariicola TaxID=1852016 RepID=A0ABS3BLZ3_9BACT|nr:hypothetical protein [Algoriphagus aestuariicola]MBN7800090.1 hypothetical protein [Algoriphagus aestuariicola]